MSAELGQQALDFTLESHAQEKVTLSQYRGKKNVVLSFHLFSFTGGWSHQVSAFRRANQRFEEKDTQVLGISVDSRAAQTAFATVLGGIPYPLLADFHPKGQVSQIYEVYDDGRGTSKRAVIIIDKDGIVRYREIYSPGQLPEPEDILYEIDKL